MLPQEKRVLLPQDLKPIESLEDYEACGGLKGLAKARSLNSEEIIEWVKRAGLRGRGGAGFPTAIKWHTVYHDPSVTKYLVCNFSEGEPGTFKDRYLIMRNPYQLIEGMLIAAEAIKAKQGIIGIKHMYTVQIERLQEAIESMVARGLMPKEFFRIVLGPNEYLFGEEKALLEVIDGRGAMPRNIPPYMVGVAFTPTENNPTVVNNVETLSHLPNIFANGVDAFRSVGTEDTPGTIMLTLCGDIKCPGVYEVPAGLSVREMLEEIGGGPAGTAPIKAIFSGVANPVMTPDHFDTALNFGSMRQAGFGLGSGGFIVYDANTCMVKVARLFSRFLAVSSCGQCIPCNSGCRAITEHLECLEDGRGRQQDIDDILVECGQCTNQTRCFLPTQESKLISSIIQTFPEEFTYHIGKSCASSKELVLPKMVSFDESQGLFIYENKEYVLEEVYG